VVDISKPDKVEGTTTYVSVLSCGTYSVSIDEIKEKGEVRQDYLGTFIRKFGRRLEDNYCILMDSLSKIGVNPKHYPRKVA
jgi:hypothetical protein